MRNTVACTPAALLLAACLSSAPPAPPVRWFDPVPAAAAAGAPRVAADLRVTAAAHLGRQFVVRTAPRELVFDGQHGWIDEPARLVAAALGTRLRSAPDGTGVLLVAVDAFELDVQAAPRAVVRLHLQWRDDRRVVLAEHAAADRSPAAFAEAMAAALADAAAAVAAVVGGD